MVFQITLQPLPPPDADFSTRLSAQDDLPYDDGMPMATPRHGFQMTLLIDALQGWPAPPSRRPLWWRNARRAWPSNCGNWA